MFGIWYIMIRKDAKLNMRPGMTAEGLRMGNEAPSFGRTKQEIDRKLPDFTWRNFIITKIYFGNCRRGFNLFFEGLAKAAVGVESQVRIVGFRGECRC